MVKENNKNIKIIFDASILAFGMRKSASRSGIYFTTLNIFDSLLRIPFINLTLLSDLGNYKDAKKLLKKEFPNISLNIIKNYDIKNKFRKTELLIPFFSDKNQKLKRFLLKCLANIIINITNLLDVLFFKLVLKKYDNYDVYFSPCWKVPRNIKKLNIKKKYILLHDVIPIVLKEYFLTEGAGYWFIKMIESLSHDDYYFTNSEHTRQDFLKYFPQIDENKITTTLLACNGNFKPCKNGLKKVLTKYNIPQDKKYIFSLCTLEPRKNLIRSVKTFLQFIKENNIDDLVYVLGGGQWHSFKDKIEQEINDIELFQQKVIKAGYIDDEDLPILYSNAEWFTYTSQYEGFGLPVLEAMSCGCPVITSNNSSLPEVIGNAGITLTWDSDREHIEAYKQYYYNPELREKNSRLGLERAKNFSWEKCVETMVNDMVKDRQ